MGNETKFKHDLVKEIKARFPGAIVTKLDPSHLQGVPDLLVLYENHWATLECKKSANAPARPNQPYYVDLMNKMSFSSFIFPENKEEVLNEMEQSFSRRS